MLFFSLCQRLIRRSRSLEFLPHNDHQFIMSCLLVLLSTEIEIFTYLYCHIAIFSFCICAGAVKDSVVGEERIAKYLLSLLNIRKTPLHWERLVHRREEFDEEPGGSCEKGSRDSLWRRRRFNNSDAVYVEVVTLSRKCTALSVIIKAICLVQTHMAISRTPGAIKQTFLEGHQLTFRCIRFMWV